MKRKIMLTLTFMIASMFLVAQVSAGASGIEFQANGFLTHYSNHQDPDRGSEIVGGTWRIIIKDGEVDFNYNYRELNLVEELEYSPEGTVDLFVGELAEVYEIERKIDHVHIWGKIHVDKMMWFLDDYSSNPLPPWFNPDWIPDNAPVAWIDDFIVRDVEIIITTYYIKILGGNLVKHGDTLNYLN